jgi:hypothetical protein
MPVNVKRLVGEPIIYAQFTGYVTEHDVLQTFEQSLDLASDIRGRIYRITETNDIELSFDELMLIIQRMGARNLAGATADPRFTDVLVGTQEATRSISENAQKQGIRLPLFDNFDEALSYIRWQIHAEN